MMKILILSENKYYAAGLKLVLKDIAIEWGFRSVEFLAPKKYRDYRQATMVFCDVPKDAGFRRCEAGYSYHLHARFSPTCHYIGLYDGKEDVLPCPSQFSSLLAHSASQAEIHGILYRLIATLNRIPYTRLRPAACTGCRLPIISLRECEALSAIAQWESLREAAAAMRVSDKTISTYRCSLKKKLGSVNNHVLHQYAIYFSGLM